MRKEVQIVTIWKRQKSAANSRRWLVSARLASGLTQSEVARVCGISRSSYQKYEYGERTPRKRVREQIDHLFSVECNRFDETPSTFARITLSSENEQQNKSGGTHHVDAAAISTQTQEKKKH